MPQLPTPDKKVNTGPQFPVRRCVEAVCKAEGCTPRELRQRTRGQPWPHRRFLVFWLALRLGAGVAETGRRVGGYDHTTVLHGCRWVERKRAADPGYFVLTEWLLDGLLNPSRTAPEAPPEPAPPEPPLPTPEPKKAVRRAPADTGNNFYGDPENDPRASRAFLEQQDARFLAALFESGERP